MMRGRGPRSQETDDIWHIYHGPSIVSPGFPVNQVAPMPGCPT